MLHRFVPKDHIDTKIIAMAWRRTFSESINDDQVHMASLGHNESVMIIMKEGLDRCKQYCEWLPISLTTCNSMR